MSWPSKALGEIFDQSGNHRAGDQNLPVLSITMRRGLVDQADKFKKRVASTDTSNYRIAYMNELVVGFPIDEGVLGFQTKYPAGIVSPAYDIWKLRDEAECHIPYLEKYLRSPIARRIYASRMQGAVARRRSLTKSDFLSLEIPFPPVDDQIRIATLLEKVEGLITQRTEQLQQLGTLLKSVFLNVFGDPVQNEKGWAKFPLEQIVENARNGLSPAKGGTFKGRVYTLSAVTGDVFREIFKEDSFSKLDKNYIPTTRDFLVCRGNGNVNLVGKGHFYPGKRVDIMFPDTVIALTIKDGAVRKSFLEALWQTSFIRNQLEKAARTANGTYKINQKTLCQIDIICPPLEAQYDFEKVASSIGRLVADTKGSLSDLNSLFGALSQQAFMGEIDLSHVPLSDIKLQKEVGETLERSPASSDVEVAIYLPDTEHMSDALESAEARETLITLWLESYQAQLSVTPFSVQRFMAAAQTRLKELDPDNEFLLNMEDYEHIKTWCFKALTLDALTQEFDEAENSVQLRVPPR